MSRLLEPLTLREVTFRNRAWVAPMCQYSSVDGFPTDWHLVHLGARAVGGAGLVFTEATAVTPEGRISPDDAGIWSDEHARAYERIAAFITAAGAVPGMQLAHAGRKASTRAPWLGRGAVPSADGGWPTVGASPLGYADWPAPGELNGEQLGELAQSFAAAARRAVGAGFRVLEVHAAHGYLLHQFLSPLANVRTDGYGGDLAGRMRLTLEVSAAVRAAVPAELPVLVRISATDWVEGGWNLDESVVLSKELASLGVDLIDVSSGGLDPRQAIDAVPGYQVPFARAIREQVGIPTGAVGMITEPAQAEAILAEGSADAVLLARALLRDPSWPLRAAHELGDRSSWPVQYERGAWPA
ncbi:MAG TPA: NADH:flavin oxidoreductase/NADH oxidase [Mycobacteriales bacterium]|nr:NADH:flavin oxidoreductase/NADH oxidase [Mycobacteriales bacterium]